MKRILIASLIAPLAIGLAACDVDQTQEGEMRHPRHQPHHQQNPGRDDQRLGVVKQLTQHRRAHILIRVLPSHYDGRGNGEQQGGDLGNQTITYGDLARELALPTPAIQTLSAMLEALMEQDAAAGRPFLAAVLAAT